MEDIERELLDLLEKIEQVYMRTKQDLEAAKRLFDSIYAAIGQTSESWSGSWVGHHANLYFRDFERPDPDYRFNIEWGTIHGIPPGWKERTELEVSQHIESLSGVSVTSLQKLSIETYNRVRPLYHDAQALVAPILEKSGGASKELLEALQNEKWGISRAAYLDQVRPSQIVSRDPGAVVQGMRTPPHIVVTSKVLSEYSRITASVDALERAILGLKQARTALRIAPSPTNIESTASSVSTSGGNRSLKRLTILLISLLAVETFILVRPYAVGWFDSTFTQDFLTQPTRLGFSWAELIANALATLVLAPFIWMAQLVFKWSKAS